MPNKHIVYMHDTPMKQLFTRFERAYSAGCIRVQGFLDLAAWALTGQDGWSIARLQQAASGGTQTTIRLTHAIPVHFVYLTAWIENGVVQFRNDLYDRDQGAFDSDDDANSRLLVRAVAP